MKVLSNNIKMHPGKENKKSIRKGIINKLIAGIMWKYHLMTNTTTTLSLTVIQRKYYN